VSFQELNSAFKSQKDKQHLQSGIEPAFTAPNDSEENEQNSDKREETLKTKRVATPFGLFVTQSNRKQSNKFQLECQV